MSTNGDLASISSSNSSSSYCQTPGGGFSCGSWNRDMPCFALVSCLPVDVLMGLLSPFLEPETIEAVGEAFGRILDAVLGDLVKLRLALGERGEPKDAS